jgi:hypothetical protein
VNDETKTRLRENSFLPGEDNKDKTFSYLFSFFLLSCSLIERKMSEPPPPPAVSQEEMRGAAYVNRMRLERVATAAVYHIPVAGAMSYYALRIVDHGTHVTLCQVDPRFAAVRLLPGGVVAFPKRPETTDVGALVAQWRTQNEREPADLPVYDHLAWLLTLALSASFDAFVALRWIDLEQHRDAIVKYYTDLKEAKRKAANSIDLTLIV